MNYLIIVKSRFTKLKSYQAAIKEHFANILTGNIIIVHILRICLPMICSLICLNFVCYKESST